LSRCTTGGFSRTAGAEILRSKIQKLIKSIWNKEEFPDQWKESIIVPLHKKGDKTDCGNYRGISLLYTSYRRRDEVTSEWWKLHNEELHNLYSSPNIIRMIKSRRMRGARHVARMGETRSA
jgi:hypothetical protein